MLWRNGDGVRIEQDSQRGEHRLVIQQRLALAHQHDVCLRLQRRAIVLQRDEHLPHDFARREIAHQAERRRQAKPAIHRAARLRRDANRLAIFFGHEHGFDVGGLGRAASIRANREDVARCAIRRRVAAHNLWQRDRGLARQTLAQRGRQIRHRGEIESPLRVERVINLRAAIRRLAKLLQNFAQLFRGFSEQVYADAGGLRGHIEVIISREELRNALARWNDIHRGAVPQCN